MCVLQFSWIHLLALIVVFSIFFKIFCIYYHATYKQWQFYVFLSNLDSFFLHFLIWLLWLELLILYWIQLARVDTLVLFLILDKILSVFQFEYNVNFGLVIYGLHYIQLFSLYTHLISFYLNICWIFKKSFSVSVVIIFIFQCVMWCIIWQIQILIHLHIPSIIFIWSWYMILLIYYSVLFSNIWLRVFSYMVISGTGL